MTTKFLFGGYADNQHTRARRHPHLKYGKDDNADTPPADEAKARAESERLDRHSKSLRAIKRQLQIYDNRTD